MDYKMKPPSERDIRMALDGDREARRRLQEHYMRLIYYMLHKEIRAACDRTGFCEYLYEFEDHLHDCYVQLESAIIDFKDKQ